MTELNELQQFLHQLTAFVHCNDEKLDFLPEGIDLDTVCFSGSLTYFSFTDEYMEEFVKREIFRDTQTVFDWADSLGFKFKGKDSK